MSSAEARQLETKLETTGTLRLTRKQAAALFDYRCRKFIRLSGKDALKRIRAGKCGNNPAWEELSVFSALL